eukprot:1455908-Prymnesium_polylepis.1
MAECQPRCERCEQEPACVSRRKLEETVCFGSSSPLKHETRRVPRGECAQADRAASQAGAIMRFSCVSRLMA